MVVYPCDAYEKSTFLRKKFICVDCYLTTLVVRRWPRFMSILEVQSKCCSNSVSYDALVEYVDFGLRVNESNEDSVRNGRMREVHGHCNHVREVHKESHPSNPATLNYNTLIMKILFDLLEDNHDFLLLTKLGYGNEKLKFLIRFIDRNISSLVSLSNQLFDCNREVKRKEEDKTSDSNGKDKTSDSNGKGKEEEKAIYRNHLFSIVTFNHCSLSNNPLPTSSLPSNSSPLNSTLFNNEMGYNALIHSETAKRVLIFRIEIYRRFDRFKDSIEQAIRLNEVIEMNNGGSKTDGEEMNRQAAEDANVNRQAAEDVSVNVNRQSNSRQTNNAQSSSQISREISYLSQNDEDAIRAYSKVYKPMMEAKDLRTKWKIVKRRALDGMYMRKIKSSEHRRQILILYYSYFIKQKGAKGEGLNYITDFCKNFLLDDESARCIPLMEQIIWYFDLHSGNLKGQQMAVNLRRKHMVGKGNLVVSCVNNRDVAKCEADRDGTKCRAMNAIATEAAYVLRFIFVSGLHTYYQAIRKLLEIISTDYSQKNEALEGKTLKGKMRGVFRRRNKPKGLYGLLTKILKKLLLPNNFIRGDNIKCINIYLIHAERHSYLKNNDLRNNDQGKAAQEPIRNSHALDFSSVPELMKTISRHRRFKTEIFHLLYIEPYCIHYLSQPSNDRIKLICGLYESSLDFAIPFLLFVPAFNVLSKGDARGILGTLRKLKSYKHELQAISMLFEFFPFWDANKENDSDKDVSSELKETINAMIKENESYKTFIDLLIHACRNLLSCKLAGEDLKLLYGTSIEGVDVKEGEEDEINMNNQAQGPRNITRRSGLLEAYLIMRKAFKAHLMEQLSLLPSVPKIPSKIAVVLFYTRILDLDLKLSTLDLRPLCLKHFLTIWKCVVDESRANWEANKKRLFQGEPNGKGRGPLERHLHPWDGDALKLMKTFFDSFRIHEITGEIEKEGNSETDRDSEGNSETDRDSEGNSETDRDSEGNSETDRDSEGNRKKPSTKSLMKIIEASLGLPVPREKILKSIYSVDSAHKEILKPILESAPFPSPVIYSNDVDIKKAYKMMFFKKRFGSYKTDPSARLPAKDVADIKRLLELCSMPIAVSRGIDNIMKTLIAIFKANSVDLENISDDLFEEIADVIYLRADV